jgi:alkylhydroperoxidase family enzyme
VGADDAQIAALERDDAEAACFTDEQRAVLRFITEFVRDARASGDTLEAVSALLSPREVVELMMVIGQYLMLARMMATTEIDIDGPVDPRR